MACRNGKARHGQVIVLVSRPSPDSQEARRHRCPGMCCRKHADQA